MRRTNPPKTQQKSLSPLPSAAPLAAAARQPPIRQVPTQHYFRLWPPREPAFRVHGHSPGLVSRPGEPPGGCPPPWGGARPPGGSGRSSPACVTCLLPPPFRRRGRARPRHPRSLCLSPRRSPERVGRALLGAGRAGAMKRSLLRLCQSREKAAVSSSYQGVVCEADAASVASQDVFKVRAAECGRVGSPEI